ncbi:outer membrane beta-barrel family protein [Xylanibacter rodentium]|uniref:outer membrane beta-barrel family protein n=1 Tax=Xylanibacter rodentium TaxID=2736289 RepID=UPI002596A08C|nr:outer membrane beta-barrel family protein [Xylanibacter rodentium]
MKQISFLLAVLICFAGFAQTEQLPDTILVQGLNEVVVKGEKPQVKGQNGIMVVDLPGIVKDKPVTNVLDALGHLPGVVNNNGMIGLAGASDVTIILNGEPTNMPVQNLYQLLYSTSVDRLKNVEVMYAAPAKYHVNGAVINVVLKTPSPLDGLQGQASMGYNQAHYGSYGVGLAATYAVGKWAFDINCSFSRTKSWNREESFSNHLYDGTRTMIEEDNRRIGRNLSNLIYASAAYNFSQRSKISVVYNGQITSSISGKSITTGTLGSTVNDSRYGAPITYHNFAVNYTAPFGLSIGGDYTNYGENRTQHLYSLPSYQELVTTTNVQSVNRIHFYIDQTHNLGGVELNYGAEYRHACDNSRQTYQLPAQMGFDNNLKEDIADVYIGMQHSFRCGLSLSANAGIEYYRNGDGHSWNFIPSLGGTYYKTPKSIFQLNFTSQRIYPSYWELHGGTSNLNDYSMVIGNPNLLPYLNYAMQFSYIFRQKYVATLYFQYGDKTNVQLPYQSPNELKLIYQTINMDYRRTFGMNINVPFNVGDVWNAAAVVNVFNHREKADKYHDISFDNSKWIFYGALDNTIRFSQSCPVALSVDFAYISPSLQGLASLSGIWKIDAGIKWQFSKKRCCELVLKANDIFNGWSPSMSINHAGQDYRMNVHDMTRNLKLAFIWRFNGFRPKETSIDTSRFGTGK